MADAESSNLPSTTDVAGTGNTDAASADDFVVVGSSTNDTSVTEVTETLSSLAVAAEANSTAAAAAAETSTPTPKEAAVTVVDAILAPAPVVEPGDDDDDNDDDDDDDEEYNPEEDDEDDDDDDVEAYLPHDEFLSLLPPVVLPRITHLKTLNDNRDAILEEYRLERAALEMKYMAKMEPLYEERRKVVTGELVQDGTTTDDGDKTKADSAGTEGEGEDEEIKGIPQFWACAMGNVDVIAEMITEGKRGEIIL